MNAIEVRSDERKASLAVTAEMAEFIKSGIPGNTLRTY